MRAVDSVVPIKKVRVKTNLKHYVLIQEKSQQYKGQTNYVQGAKNSAKIKKNVSSEDVSQEKSSYWEEKVIQNSKRPKELCKTVKSLALKAHSCLK